MSSNIVFKNERLVAIIDDDESYRRATQRLLKAYGWNAISFGSAHEFLETTTSFDEFGCLLVDIHMPLMNGTDLLSKIRSEGSKTPVVFVTAHKLSESQQDIANKLSNGVLTKPCDAPEFLESLQNAYK